MKILLINDHAHFGGGGDAVLILERENMLKRGHEVYSYSWGQQESAANQPNTIVAPEPPSKREQKIAKFFGNKKLRLHFRETLQNIRPDIIHIHLISKYPLAVYPELAGYPVLQTLHGPNLFCLSGWGNLKKNCQYCPLGIGVKCLTSGCVSLCNMLAGWYLNKKLSPWLKNVITKFHSPSVHLGESVKNLGFKNVKYIPLGIDPSFITQIPEPWPRRKELLFVGALAEQKGVNILIEAFIQVTKVVPEAILHVAGRGIMEESLRSRICESGIEKQVIFHGFVGRETVINLYKHAYAFIIPSCWRENAPVVVTEGLSCRTPGIGSNLGGIKELLQDADLGFVVPPRDANALADKMIWLLQHPDTAAEIGMKARDFVINKYDPEKYLDTLESEFQILLKEKD